LETRKALILLAHGSRASGAFEEMMGLAELLQSRHAGIAVSAAFLSLAPPDLAAAIAKAVDGGAREISILPLFFFSGKHVLDDVPRLAAQAQADHPGTRIVLLEAAGRHPDFAAFLGRAAGLAAE
jgi:sirohydrochlorin ferrochelatase